VRIIDNVNELPGDDLKSELGKDSKLPPGIVRHPEAGI
jgi:hypothetical protein